MTAEEGPVVLQETSFEETAAYDETIGSHESGSSGF